ncbi:isochorismatase family [Colletotrichum karsti]|uniref:Isochorismatase family n=1 Tax=Colletotrichum karsti TaxID=1095194 RepID=A0A9P6I0A6_9PEZI|nr:isochorismatase family [Colletotrichum karsti]KAF9871641.1 isochorismatase family [Colletotrichum karsti]
MSDTAHQRRLQRPVIFVCDLQDKFRNAIFEFDKVVKTTSKLLRAAETLKIPVYTTTQNRARLGDTVPELASLLKESDLIRAPVDKTKFSMWVPEISRQFEGKGPAQVILVGIESHICVTQTALDVLAAGHKPYVLADGVSSCNREEVPIALARLRHEGVTVTTSESILYELMGDAAVPEFKSIVGLVKETGKDTKEGLQALVPKI